MKDQIPFEDLPDIFREAMRQGEYDEATSHVVMYIKRICEMGPPGAFIEQLVTRAILECMEAEGSPLSPVLKEGIGNVVFLWAVHGPHMDFTQNMSIHNPDQWGGLTVNHQTMWAILSRSLQVTLDGRIIVGPCFPYLPEWNELEPYVERIHAK